jgi:hypothetical protein
LKKKREEMSRGHCYGKSKLQKKKNQKRTMLKGKEYCKEDLFMKFSKAILCSKWKRKKARFGTKRKKILQKRKIQRKETCFR